LTATQNGTSPYASPSHAKPVVCFGSRTETFEKQIISPTAILQKSGLKGGKALHLVNDILFDLYKCYDRKFDSVEKFSFIRLLAKCITKKVSHI